MGGVLAATLTTGVLVAVPPIAHADPRAPIVTHGVPRDNVDNTHSPRMTAELDEQRAATPPAMAAADVQGIDVASHQHPGGAPIDWNQVAGAGYRSVAIKSSEGNYYTNPYYPGDRTGAAAAGMYTYAYHFAIPNVSSGTAQADYFLDRAGYRQDGATLPPALDVEANPYVGDDGTNACYGLTQSQMVTWIRDFLAEVERRTGVDAIIYTGASWWRDCTGGSSAFADHPLWVASYASTPTMPPGWPDHTIWQYTNQGSVPGISAATDLNYIRGGEATLSALATQASDPAGYTPADPVRVLDTRNAVGVGTRTPLGPRGSVTLDLAGRLPATATAAVLNVTGITTTSTYVTVWPNGSPQPAVSNLNLTGDEIRPNLVTVKVGADRRVRLYNHNGSTHLLADLAGWYATDATGLYTARSPQRVLDTRPGAPLGTRTTRTLDLSTFVPADATAVTLNLTGVGATQGTYVSAWPSGQPRPPVSNLNLADANPTPNLVTVKLGANRAIDLYNHWGSVDLLADLAGWYAPGEGSSFVAVTPWRLLDTRTKAVTWVPTGGTGRSITLDTSDAAGVTGAVINLTGVSPSTATFVSAYPKTSATPVRPGSSNLNLPRGRTASNLVSTALGSDAEIWLYNNAGTIHLIADVAGYFTR
ncbi:MAG TPA: GH25 family lysozyme [Actinophytocola sp.]|nr:GH25 family lysozyme [Actinophytocola sp.]